MKKREKTTTATAASWNPPEELPNGNLFYTIPTEYSVITCEFSPEKIKSLLREMIVDLFNKARTGSVDASVTIPGPGVHYLVEIKQRNVRGLAWGKESEKEIQEEIDFYAKEACQKFSADLEKRLLHGPPTYIVETIAATIGSLEKEGALLTRIGTAPFIKELFDALLSRFKTRWDMPGSGRPELAGARKRALILDYYETLMLIAKAQKNAKSRRVKEDLQDAARKAAENVDPAVLEKIAKGVRRGTSAGDIAWQIASQKYLPKKNNHDRRILTEARKERASRERGSK
jgi:hypothetical protein